MNGDIDRTDRRLRALHSAMGDDLDALLDLDGGLREVLIAAQHHDLGRTLDDILDVDAGLQAIVPITEQHTTTPAADTPAPEITKVDGAVATWLMSLDTPARLAIRNHPALDALAILFTLTEARLTACTLTRAHDHDHVLNLDHALDHARHDFTTADLRGIDLTDVQLDRLRWSAITQWPSETWRDQALLDSTEIEPGIYEVRGGTTNVPMHIP